MLSTSTGEKVSEEEGQIHVSVSGNLRKKRKTRCCACFGCYICIILILILYFSLRPKRKTSVNSGEILTLNISDLDVDKLEFDNMELPTSAPTISPTITPTIQPTISPTNQPTTPSPTIQPTTSPTDAPTNQPTPSPTYASCVVDQVGHLTCVKNIAYGSCNIFGSNQWYCSCIAAAVCIGNDRCNGNNEDQYCDSSLCKEKKQGARSCILRNNTESPTRNPTTKSPTLSPTTPYPTRFPTTRRPTRSPTTRRPTRFPTRSPTTCTGVLSIEVGPFASTSGIARLWVHNSATTWARDYGMTSSAFLYRSKSIDNKNKMTWNFYLPPNYYGIFALDDEDRDGKMDTTWIGMPEEGVGVSNGAKGGPWGGPKWNDARFFLSCGQYKKAILTLWVP